MYNALVIAAGLVLTITWAMLIACSFEQPVSIFVSFLGGIVIGACVGQLIGI